jgi:DNA-binding MarR family transcriptional regulator
LQGNATKRELMEALLWEVRAGQTAVDTMDDAAAKALGINRTDGRCLDIIDREGPLTAGRLAERAGLTTAAVTTVLDRLERAGYARRVRDDADRRRVLVEVTQHMRDRAAEIWGVHEQATNPFERYTKEELELLLDFHRMARAWNEQRAAVVRQMTR